MAFAAGVAATGNASDEAAAGERPATRLERRVVKDILILIVRESGRYFLVEGMFDEFWNALEEEVDLWL